jgi:hypothetical protein
MKDELPVGDETGPAGSRVIGESFSRSNLPQA